MERKNLEISWVGLWRIFIFALFVVLMFFSRDILLGLFLAIVISSGLEVPITMLEKLRIPRTIGVIFVFLLLLLTIVIVLYAIVPLIILNLNTAIFDIQEAAGNAWWRDFFNFKAARSINEVIDRVITEFLSSGVSPLDVFSQVLGGLSLTVSVFVISFYLTLSRNGVERFIRAVLPLDYEEAALKIYENSRQKIGFWFRAQIVMSFIMGVMVWLTLSLIGVKYAFLLGAIAGILELIPFVGPILAGAASVLVAFTASSALAVYTLLAFLILQQFESNILVPFLTRRAVGLHPIIVIVALLMGIQIGGFLGAIIAVPVAAVFQEVIEEWAGKRKVGGAEA